MEKISNSGAVKRTGIQPEGPSKRSSASNSPVGSNECKLLAEYEEETARNDMLPEEMLLEIFSYLDGDALLSSRRVCRSWNRAIVTWGKFKKNKSFIVRRGRVSNSYAVLNSSTVRWEKVELHRCITSNYPSWNFPNLLNESLTMLTLRKCVITWASMMDIASRFQSLEKLILVDCQVDCQSLNAQVVPFADAPKRAILLKLKMENYRSLNFCLEQFTTSRQDSPFVLTGLELSVPVHEFQYMDDYGIELLSVESTELLEEFSTRIENLTISCETRSVKLIDSFESGNTYLHLMMTFARE